MKKISKKMIVAIAIIVIVGIIYYFENIKEYKAEIPLSSVIIAKDTIPENTIITKDMIVKEKRYTSDLLKQKGFLTSKEEKVLGKRTRVPVYKHEAINIKRLIENEPYMDDDDGEKKTMFVISIENKDKALNISKGSYIDIWIEPKENGLEVLREKQYPIVDMPNGITGLLDPKSELDDVKNLLEYKNMELTKGFASPVYHISHPIFKKVKVYDVKTEMFTDPQSSSTDQKKDIKDSTVTYLTLYLTDMEIATYLDIKDWDIDKRLTLYGSNVEYSITGEKFDDEGKALDNKTSNSLDSDNN